MGEPERRAQRPPIDCRFGAVPKSQVLKAMPFACDPTTHMVGDGHQQGSARSLQYMGTYHGIALGVSCFSVKDEDRSPARASEDSEDKREGCP